MPSTNGSGARKLPSFIDTFVADTANIGAPEIFRRWAAISTIAGVLEQKVWVKTRSRLHPNLFIFLIGHPGVGKTRICREARLLMGGLPEPFLAPISMTWASLVDAMVRCKRVIVRQPEGEIVYNQMTILADEMGAFINKYDGEMIDGLSAFYDATPYQQERRGNEVRIRIDSPLINMLVGSTPQNLLGVMPEKAWGQGFCSRSIFVFSDKRVLVDDFAEQSAGAQADMLHDLKIMNGLFGEFHVTEDYQAAVKQWQQLGEPPIPGHPKLIHYVTRRRVNIYKLSMVSSVNRDNSLVLTEADFLQALEWLVGAETNMEDIFKAGAMNADAAAMDEIAHYVMSNDLGTGVHEQRIVHFAQRLVPSHTILRVIDIMLGSGQITLRRTDLRTKARFFSAPTPTAGLVDGLPTRPLTHQSSH